MNYHNVTRLAILIGCPGVEKNFLRGVSKDLENVSQFLRSDKGGSWDPDEILILKNPTWASVNEFVSSHSADYVMVYFSGHGFTDAGGNRMIVLQDYAVPDVALFTESQRQLTIVDACRNFVSGGLSGFPDFGDATFHYEGSGTREVFDTLIKGSPYGRTIVHATQKGKYSYDTASGGGFTQALLQLSTRIPATNAITQCQIENIIKHIPAMLSRQGNDQVPVITFKTGNLQVPFALGVPGQNVSTARRSRTIAHNNSAGSDWAAVGLLALVVGVVVVAASSK